jgi:His-Xaa-Ser system protein HxsD
MPSTRLSWVQSISDEKMSIQVNLDVYSLEVVFRVCYLFTDRCYLFITEEVSMGKDAGVISVEEYSTSAPANTIIVHFARKTPDCDLSIIAGEFSNELINQRVRLAIADETRMIRELIVTQAFTEADLLDRSDSEADYRDDPRGISK